MWNKRPSFRLEIENFSKKESSIISHTFVDGGCEWYLYVYPKGDHLAENHLSSFLHVANPTLLPTGWKRSVKYYFVVLNKSDKELYKSPIVGSPSTLFCAKSPSWGFREAMPLSKLKEKGVLENDKLIIEVYINVLEAVDGEVEDINGFKVFASQVRKKFSDHMVKAEYKSVLSNTCNKLSELAEVGPKMDWLKLKLDEVSLKVKKKGDDVDDGSRFQLLEERIKNLEVMESSSKIDVLNSKLEEISSEKNKHYGACVEKLEELIKNNLEIMESSSKMDVLTSKLEEISLEMNKPYDAIASCFRRLGERVRKLEVMELECKMDALKSRLEEESLERKKLRDADRSRIEELEERINEFEFGFVFQLKCLKSEFEDDTLKRKKTHDADVSRIQKLEDDLEDNVENLELMVSDLKNELDKKKDKSFADGFTLVD